MREEIERVIAELEFLSAQYFDTYNQNKWDTYRQYDFGKSEAFEYAAEKLKAVLADGTNDRSPIPEHGETQAE